MLSRALGRRPPVLDPRTLRLAKYLRDVPAPPPARDWSERLPRELDLYRNDQIGVCGVASAAHLQSLWASQHDVQFAAGTGDVLEAYRTISGYDGRPETDRGTDMLSVCRYWRTHGIAGRRIRAFVKLDHDDPLQIRIALNLFGGVYAGASLPRFVTDPAALWDAPSSRPRGDAAPGSWGGHAMAAVAYSRTAVCFVTWGRRKWATWPFWLAYVDECYAIVDDAWVREGILAPNGFDLEALLADLAEIA